MLNYLHLNRRQKQWVAVAALLSVVALACGPWDRLREANQQQQAAATSAVMIRNSSQLAANAYKKIETLPGYRLESRHLVRDESTGRETSQVVIKTLDEAGNFHLQTQSSDGTQTELFFVDGHTYLFDPEYQGWVDSGAGPATEVQPAGEISTTDSMHRLTQFGATPTQSGHETLNERPATRYRLTYVVAEMAELFDQELAEAPFDLRGTLWVDDETGALLKSELLLYEDETGRPAQEFILEISGIGQVDSIGIPTPVVDPVAIVAATATAAAWTILEAKMIYQDEQISIELIPLEITPAPDSVPRSARVKLLLRQLPENLGDLEPFLTQVRQQLSLSIPERNLVVGSSGYQLETTEPTKQRAELFYFFEADLAGFDHAELIFSGVGNPLFVPVPVTRATDVETDN